MEPKYKLTVIKYEENKNYEAEMAEYKAKDRGGYYHRNLEDMAALPSRENATRSLEVILTEDEYRKLKSEVLTQFD